MGSKAGRRAKYARACARLAWASWMAVATAALGSGMGAVISPSFLTQGAGDWHLPQELIRPIMSPWCAVIAPHCQRPCAYRRGCASGTFKAYPPTIAPCSPAIAASASFFLVALSHIHIPLVVGWLQQPVAPPSWLIFQPCQPFLHKSLDPLVGMEPAQGHRSRHIWCQYLVLQV